MIIQIIQNGYTDKLLYKEAIVRISLVGHLLGPASLGAAPGLAGGLLGRPASLGAALIVRSAIGLLHLLGLLNLLGLGRHPQLSCVSGNTGCQIAKSVNTSRKSGLEEIRTRPSRHGSSWPAGCPWA